MRFTDAHSSSGICTPSRYALLTGRHHWRDFHGIVNAFGKSVLQTRNSSPCPKCSRKKGYATACIGKWHLGWDWDAIRKPGAKKKLRHFAPEDFDWSKPIPGGPLDHGFDHYFGDTVINFPPYCWIEDDKVLKASRHDDGHQEMEGHQGRQLGMPPGPMVTGWDPYQNIPRPPARGVEYIRSRKGLRKPFFLYFAYPSPHAPIIPNDEFDGKSKAGPYGDFVNETDHSVGQLLKALADSGQADNTIVIFSADNGPEKYAYARDEKFDHWSSHPLRGLKRDIYEGGHRVPTIIKWPGVTKAGASATRWSRNRSHGHPGRRARLQLPADAAEDSHDLLPFAQGRDRIRAHHPHPQHLRQHYAIRHGDWLLIDAKPAT
jgi:arylsulfatase A